LIDRSQGRWRLRGGAGGATAVGCGLALSVSLAWVLIVAPVLLFGVGYASVTTLVVGALMAVGLSVQAYAGSVPWAYVAFGLGAEVLMLLALRPNLMRLRRGEERFIGLRGNTGRGRTPSGPAGIPRQ
jgi:glycerol-3-phosphate acyltransferase PlsY